MQFPLSRNAAGFLACCAVVVPLLAGACDKVLGPKSKSFVVSPDTATVQIGGRAYVRVSMTKLAPLAVAYASLNPNVAVVDDSSGLVRGVGAGSATILAWPVADSSLVDSLRVQVLPRSGSWVVLYPDSVRLLQGATRQLGWRVSDTTHTGVVLRSSDSTVARVDSTGLVCGKRGGSNALIRAIGVADSTARDSARIFVVTPLPTQKPPGC